MSHGSSATAQSELSGSFLPSRSSSEGGLVDLLLRSVAADPHRPHLRWPGGEMSVGAFADRARRWATVLRKQGVEPGERVAFVCTNSADFLALQFATYMCAAVEVPINAELRGEMLAAILTDADPTLIVIDEQIHAIVVAHLPRDVGVLILDEKLRTEVSAVMPIEEPATPGASELAVILYTSGTTGPSKGVMLPHGYLPSTAATWIAAMDITASDTWYLPVPLFHVDGHVVNALGLICGATVGFTKRFSVSRFWSESEALGATRFLAVGSMLSALAGRRPERSPEHTYRASIGAPITEEAYEYFEDELGIPLLQLYGQTEADGVVFSTPDRRRRGAAGWACCGFDVRIVDADDSPVPLGESGNLVYRPHGASQMTIGYWRQPQATADCARNLWWHSGDLAHVDSDGFLWFDGRASDSLRRRGENISAWELESAIREAPGVRTAAVVAVQDDIGGEDEIKVFVSLADGCEWDPRGFFDYCSKQLPRYAQPRYVSVIAEEDFVRGPGSGAVQKHRLPQGELGHTTDRLEVAA